MPSRASQLATHLRELLIFFNLIDLSSIAILSLLFSLWMISKSSTTGRFNGCHPSQMKRRLISINSFLNISVSSNSASRFNLRTLDHGATIFFLFSFLGFVWLCCHFFVFAFSTFAPLLRFFFVNCSFFLTIGFVLFNLSDLEFLKMLWDAASFIHIHTVTFKNLKTNKLNKADLILLNPELFLRSTRQLWIPLLRIHKTFHKTYQLRLLQWDRTSDRPLPLSSFSVCGSSAATSRAFFPCSSHTTWAARPWTFPASSRKKVFSSTMSTGFISITVEHPPEVWVVL